jgi:polysaccharide pyruvyl transferase WcaK-like protein
MFAAAQGVPFVPIDYDPKVSSFASAVGARAGLAVGSLRSRELADAIKQEWASRAETSARLTARSAELRGLALDSGRLMKQLLERRLGT